ncbi:ribosome recycling factor [Allorhodopirellula solitaria]|uniref:Ribosome-recycling factor n=1 Tax=Allorhodopirellula solitaria TaxID=2527987 RepID=A0A5C5XTR0_9BACT|nr:ribosome recycling factor [Allorhodopirellula solitaria]TWT65969.1 Ribosome-recycling factor [Allorhodopirellula solitaria]
MTSDEILMDAEERMEKAVSVLSNNLAGIRTGRANPGLVESIKVEVYGSFTPLKQLASIGTPEPQQILIRPYDASTIKEIEKAIVAGDLGLNPQNDGRVIRLNVPALSTEVRKKMVGRIKELGEEAKISIRNIRRDANKAADQSEKDNELTEDDRDRCKEQVQELTKKHETTVNDSAKAREAEVLEA